MSKRLPCPEWEERLALKREDLSPADRSALESHLLTCSGCQATQQSYARLVTHLQNLPTPIIQPLPRLRNVWETESKQQTLSVLFQRARSQGNHRFRTLFACLGIAALIFLALFSFYVVLPFSTHLGTSPTHAATQLCIGTDFPITGTDESQGIPAQNGANLAISQHHDLGQGYMLTSCNRDDASPITNLHDPVLGVANVTAFVKDPNVVGIVGPGNSNVAEAEIPVVTSAGLAMVSSETTDLCLTLLQYCAHPDQVHPPGKSDAFFRLSPNDAEQGKADADFMFKILHRHTACVVDDGEVYGRNLATFFSATFRVNSGDILGTRQHIAADQTQAQLAHVAQACVALHPEAVFYGGVTSNGAGLLKRQLTLAGFTGPFVGGDGIVSDSLFLLNAGAAANNTYATSLGPDPSSFAHTTFTHDYQVSYGAQPDRRSAGAYDAAMILITAIQSAIKTGPVNGASLRRAVLDHVMHPDQPYHGLTGTITFDSNGDNTAKRLLTVYAIQNGKWVYQPDDTVAL